MSRYAYDDIYIVVCSLLCPFGLFLFVHFHCLFHCGYKLGTFSETAEILLHYL